MHRHVQVWFNRHLVADTRRAYRVLEKSHPPSIYIPPADVDMACLRHDSGSSLCEWKGQASYYTVVVGDQRAVRAAWSYHNPWSPFQAIRDYLAFYPGPMEACMVDGQRVRAQPGCFYGGWITREIVGPFKGVPGSREW
jgi:uncharacterized protein (DUF427 family)